jgi:hypothetical protein
MADEELAIAPVEQAQPAIAPEATTELPADEPVAIPDSLETEEATGDEPTGEPEAEETDELDFGFEKYTVPKKLKAAVEEWRAATTKKEQTVSERQRALDAREAEITQQAQVTEEELQDRAILVGLKSQLDQYRNTDWVNLWRTDPVAAGEHQARFQQLQQLEAQTSASLNAKQTERTQKAQQAFAKRIEETEAFARKEIPGWKPELDVKLIEFATSEGVPQEFLRANMSPTLYKLLHRAYIGSQTLQKAAAPKPAAALKPLETVTGKATPTARADLASADMDAYIAARRKGIGGKANF